MKITRRFNSLLSAIETLETEGKLDLSYNRPLAISDAKYTDRRYAPTVLEVGGKLNLIVRAHDGMLCMTEYSPFASCMHGDGLAILMPATKSGVFCQLWDAVIFLKFGKVPNTPVARAEIAKANLVAGN